MLATGVVAMPRLPLCRVAFALLTALLSIGSVFAADLTIGLATDITAIDPHYHNVTPNNSVAFHIFGYLVERNEKSRGLRRSGRRSIR
jgi:hypothetical protein